MAVTITAVVFVCCMCVTHADFRHQSHPVAHMLSNKQRDVNIERNRREIVPNSRLKTRAIYHLLRRPDIRPGTRRYQRSSGTDIYSHLAALTGGSVIGSNKTDIDHASSITVAEASLASPVVVMVTHVNAATPRDVTFSVDAALTLILVEVTGHVTKSAIQLSDPAGASVSDDKLTVDSAGALVYKIAKPAPGNWKLHLSDKLQCDVIVKGSSDVSFQSQFMEVNPVTGYDISVPGNPPAGKNLTMAIEVNGADKTQNITRVTLYTLNGDVIKSAVLTHVGRRGARYKATISLPSQDVRLGISGADNHGARFTRVLQAAVSPESAFTVTFNMTAGESATVDTDGVRLPFVVTNDGPSGNFSARATSVNTVLNPVVMPQEFSLLTGHTYTGTVAVTANITAPSTAGDVVLTVTGPSGVSDFASRPVVIYSRPTAKTTPASNTSTSINKDATPLTTAAVSFVSKDVASATTADTFKTATPGGLPDSTASTPGGLPDTTTSTSEGSPASKASTSGGLPGSTASTSGTPPGSTASTSGTPPGSTASTSRIPPGSTASTSGGLPDKTASTSEGSPASKASTSGGLPGSTASTSGTPPGSTASTSGTPPGSTASTSRIPPGSTASTSGTPPGSTASTSRIPPGSTASTSGTPPGSTASTSGTPPGSTASTSGRPPGSTASTSGTPPGSTASTSRIPPGSTASTSRRPPGSTASTSGTPPGSTASTSRIPPGSTASTSGTPPGSTASTSGRPPGSTASTSGTPPGSTASTSRIPPGSTASTSGTPPGSTASTSGTPPGSTPAGLTGSTASTSGALPGVSTSSTSGEQHAMKPAIIASIVCGCVAAVAGVGLCVLFLTRRGLTRADSEKLHHYKEAGQYSSASIDKGRYNAGYEMDLYQSQTG